jgi:hypothetical protein
MAVTWSVQEQSGGTIDSSGVYTAPATEGTYRVIATSQADSTKTATATVTVKAEPITISISPEAVTLTVGGTQEFNVSLTGENPGPVIWTLEEENRGSITVSDNAFRGDYTAPEVPGTYHVKVALQTEPKIYDRAIITVKAQPISVSIEPKTAQIIYPDKQIFKAKVTGSNNTAVTWKVKEGPAGGSIVAVDPETGEYSPPEPEGSSSSEATYHVVATSESDTSKFAEAAVTVSVVVHPLNRTQRKNKINCVQEGVQDGPNEKKL